MHRNPNCGQCGRFSLPKDDRLSEHGFGRCTQLPEWHRVSEAAPCRFTPERFEVRA